MTMIVRYAIPSAFLVVAHPVFNASLVMILIFSFKKELLLVQKLVEMESYMDIINVMMVELMMEMVALMIVIMNQAFNVYLELLFHQLFALKYAVMDDESIFHVTMATQMMVMDVIRYVRLKMDILVLVEDKIQLMFALKLVVMV